MESNADAAHIADNEGDNLSNPNQHLEKNNIILREGNVAYEIERPLFNTDASIDLVALRSEFMQKVSVDKTEETKEIVNSLPPTRYLTDQSEEID